jgi:hypothetical protein
VVRSLGTSIYLVRDGGPATCDDGSAAHLFHLTARTDRAHHPATDVTIDTTTNTVCTIRFEMQRNDLVDRNGYVELHLGSIDSFYVVKRGEISFVAGPRLGRQHVRLFLDYARIAFPQAIPQGAFGAASETHER